MKTSFISSMSMQTTLRHTMAKAQQQLTAATNEAATGVHNDIGVALGSATARSLDLNRDVIRIQSLIDTNAIATQRLESSDEALDKMAQSAQSVLAGLLALTDSSQTVNAVKQTIEANLTAFTGFANSAVKGEYLFSGVNTDVKPLEDYSAANSPIQAAVDRELQAFMTANGIATEADITNDQMATFLGDLEKKFMGEEPITSPPHPAPLESTDFWTAFVSNASDVNMKSRISQGEIVQTSTNANTDGMRSFVFGSIVAIEFLGGDFANVQEAVVQKSRDAIGRGETGITAQRSSLGLSAERVKKADESLKAQQTIIKNHLLELEGIDVEEASVRVNALKLLLETSYTLTGRLQSLSLVNYL
jgi:flagellar hook-associated protein 3 FlgL